MQEELLSLLASSRPIYVALAGLPALLPDHAPESIVEALEALQAADLATVWANAPGGPSAVLTVAGAARLGMDLELDDSGTLKEMSWIAAGQVRSIKSRVFQPAAEDIAEVLNVQPDPKAPKSVLDGLVSLESRESRHRERRKSNGDYGSKKAIDLEHLNISTMLGIGFPCWTPAVEHKPASGRRCKVCGSRTLKRSRACLACLQSGVDYMLPKVRQPSLHRLMPDTLKGGVA